MSTAPDNPVYPLTLTMPAAAALSGAVMPVNAAAAAALAPPEATMEAVIATAAAATSVQVRMAPIEMDLCPLGSA